MLSTLDDPFTRFLEPEKFKSLRVWFSFFYVISVGWCLRKSSCIIVLLILISLVSGWNPSLFFLELHSETCRHFIWRQSGTQGTLTGVGLSIGFPTGLDKSSTGLLVISSSPGGPADKAGILPGDIILAINDMTTEDMDIYEAAERLQ